MDGIMKKRTNKPMIEFLEIDEKTYIENDVIKSRLNENITPADYVSWDDLWESIYDAMSKIRKYDETHNQSDDC